MCELPAGYYSARLLAGGCGTSDQSDHPPHLRVVVGRTDNVGSVRDVIDSNGDLRVHRRFDAFGGVIAETHYNTSGSAVTTGQTGYVDVNRNGVRTIFQCAEAFLAITLRSGGQESRLNSIRMYTMLACASRSPIFDNSAVSAPHQHHSWRSGGRARK